MQSSAQDPAPAAAAQPAAHGHGAGGAVTPRSDFVASIAWMALGVAISILAYNMDRLENQDVPPYAVPGLLPFFLGLAFIFFGGLMLIRSWQRGALASDATWAAGMTLAERKRFLIVLALCLAFAILLIGHGLPFWLAATIFVSATITVLQWQQRKAAGELMHGFLLSIVIGLGAGLGVTIVFQYLFLVTLP